MLSILASIPIFAFLVIFQSAVVSRLPLIQGFPDLVLLTIIAWALQERVTTSWQWGAIGALLMGYVSSIPFLAPVMAYLLSVLIARVFQKRVWKTPVLAMLVTTFLGTLLYSGFSFVLLRISGVSIPFTDTFRRITLPSLLLNLGLAIPVYIVVKELGGWFYPEKEEI